MYRENANKPAAGKVAGETRRGGKQSEKAKCVRAKKRAKKIK